MAGARVDDLAMVGDGMYRLPMVNRYCLLAKRRGGWASVLLCLAVELDTLCR